MSKTRKTHVNKKPMTNTPPMVVHEGELLMSFSYDCAKAEDEQGNPIQVYIWLNGDWKLNYKGKEYLIRLNDNVGALIDYINSQEK